MRKKSMAFLLAVALLAHMFPAMAFSDLQGYAWCENDIAYLNERALLRGTTTETFSPAAKVTRGDFAVLAVRVFGLEADYISDNFADITSDMYFYKPIGILKLYRIVSGIDQQHYCPDNQILRQDMAVMLWRLMCKMGYCGEGNAGKILDTYQDGNQVGEYAREAVAYMIENKIMTGKTEMHICPQDTVTRAEMAVMMARICRFLEQSYGN